MRLKLNELKQIKVFTSTQADDGYISMAAEYQPDRSAKANVQAADRKLNAEIYGERVSEMLILYLCEPNRLKIGEGIAFDGEAQPTHKVIGCKQYRFHSVVTAEVMR